MIEMGGALARMEGRRIQGFWWEDLMGRVYSENSDADRRIILKYIFNKWDGRSMDWIILAKDTDRWRAPVNAVMILRVP